MKMYYIISSTHKFQSVERLNTVTDNSKKAKKICNENFLGNLFVSNTSSQFSAIKAQCKPSMRTFAVNKAAYYFIKLVLLKETAFVHSAVCTCKAGFIGVCSHVGGLLFTLVKIKVHVLLRYVSGSDLEK